mmetsp:Transcript_29/g.89  ORF Transcript_29/g.89 Transcript_29/m.89 type:complete len:279 (-) Transcript_29:1072-1908(-)
MPSSTITTVCPSARSISSTSPLMSYTVILSGAWMLYHTHSVLRFCATTTSLSGTHCTYVQYVSSVCRVWCTRSNRCSWWRRSRNRSRSARALSSSQSTLASCVTVAVVRPVAKSSTRTVCASSRNATLRFGVGSPTPPNGAPSMSVPRRGGRSSTRTLMRCGDMCSVRHAPMISLRPYSITCSSPAAYTSAQRSLSNTNFSLGPDPAPDPPPSGDTIHGTSDSLHVSRSPSSSVSVVWPTRNRSWCTLSRTSSCPNWERSVMRVPEARCRTMTCEGDT